MTEQPTLELERDGAARYPVEPAAGARDQRLGREVDIKRMAGPVTAVAVERFVREARLQGRLEHPAIVPVLDVGLDGDGRPYFVMRRVAGTPLSEIVRQRGAGDRDAERRFPLRRLLVAFVDVCLAVEYAHRRGVVHRDLRPEHILLGDFGEVYVQDWGNARLVDADGSVRRETLAPPLPRATIGSGVGTAGYAAPEQLTHEPDIDARADVYALGCVLFELLCGRPLHARADSVESTLLGVDVQAAARAAGRHGPPELLDAVAAATRRRAERTASARELAEAVERWLDGVRELARRRELAARCRERARVAMDAGDRAAAMREAGAALSLVPDDGRAAELLGRLVLEPPDAESDEGRAVIADSDADHVRAQVRVAAVSYLWMVAFMPVLLLLGVRDATVPLAVAALAAAQAAFAYVTGRGRPGIGTVWIATLANVALLALHTRIFGPVLCVPAMATTVVIAAISRPTVRPWWLVPVLIAVGVLGPWALEGAGVLAPTTWANGDAVIVASEVVALPRQATLAILAVHTTALLLVAANFGRQLAQVNRAARVRLRTQGWHLAQITRRDDRPSSASTTGERSR